MSYAYIVKVILLSLISGTATFLGVFIGRRLNRQSGVIFGVSFAAGIMILIALLELLPAAFHTGKSWVAAVSFIFGIAILWAVNKILPHLHTIKEVEKYSAKNLVRMAYLLAIGLVLHDFPEGFAIPSSFGQSAAMGLVVVLATFIHNIPEGYILSVASQGRGGLHFKSALFSTISTLAGSIIGLILLNSFHFLNSIFLALAAGAMIFIAGHELIPYLKNIGINTKQSYLGFVGSAIIYFLLIIII